MAYWDWARVEKGCVLPAHAHPGAPPLPPARVTRARARPDPKKRDCAEATRPTRKQSGELHGDKGEHGAGMDPAKQDSNPPPQRPSLLRRWRKANVPPVILPLLLPLARTTGKARSAVVQPGSITHPPEDSRRFLLHAVGTCVTFPVLGGFGGGDRGEPSRCSLTS